MTKSPAATESAACWRVCQGASAAPALLVTHGDDSAELQSIETAKLTGNGNTLTVGANVGQSVVEFQRDFPAAVILSFEPDKNSFDILQRINGRAYNLAVSSSSGQLRFDNRSPVSEVRAIASDQGDDSLPIVSVTTSAR